MIRSKWLALAATVLLIAGVAWYFASPGYTLTRTKAAAESNDAEAMASYIDFPSLREDLKADMLAQMMAEVQKDNSPFSGFAMAIGPAMVSAMVDGYVTPAGMKAIFASKRTEARPSGKAERPAESTFKLEDQPIIKRRGLSDFLVATKKDPNSGMVFKRHGLGWKLSGVELPATTRP
jgi:hypothetical protein